MKKIEEIGETEGLSSYGKLLIRRHNYWARKANYSQWKVIRLFASFMALGYFMEISKKLSLVPMEAIQAEKPKHKEPKYD